MEAPPVTIHLLACFHTQLKQTFSGCAFSGKSLRFSKMMHLIPNYRVVEYSNAGSESEADEKVVMLNEDEFKQFYPPQKPHEFHGSYATIGERGWPLFNARLIMALRDHIQPGDIIGHQFGRAHQQIPSLFPNNVNVELGIGYQDKPFGCFRIFESEAWKHYHFGMCDQDPLLKNDRGMNRIYSFVAPNYFDLDDWPYFGPEQNEDYVIFMGRITPEKGMQTLVEIIRADEGKTRFVFAGQGNFDELIAKQIIRKPNPFVGGVKAQVEFVGPVYGRDRAALVGKARCMFSGTNFVEPFCGSAVESMLTGTPALGSPFGAFTETINHGLTGYRCHTLGDWLAAIDASKYLNRKTVSDIARSKYSLEAIAPLYDAAFRQIADLSAEGWYSRASHHIPKRRREYGFVLRRV